MLFPRTRTHMHIRPAGFVALACAALFVVPVPARAADRLCDTAFEDCRSPLRQLIQNETVGIDVAFWFMEDARYTADLIRKFNEGVPVRVLMDTRAASEYGYNAQAAIDQLREAGIPLRRKSGGGILHWKMMLFAGQNVVQFSGANYSAEAFVPIEPYVNYVDEIIYFTDNPAYVNSFKTRYDDVWTATSGYANYANVTELRRHYGEYPNVHPVDPALNFVPWQNFRSRSVAHYKVETEGIDSIMYRITDRAHTDQMIAAVGRGVPVRLIGEPNEYRNPGKYWVSWNLDRMYKAGVQLRMREHAGLSHEKLTLMHSQGLSVFGSSNWTSASATDQLEHNLFSTDPAHFQWLSNHFERKWNNTGPSVESAPFVPLPPDRPTLKAPANSSTGHESVTLTWNGGYWAHKFDVYIGTSPTSMTKIVNDLELGPVDNHSLDLPEDVLNGRNGERVAVSYPLAAGTTYYWKIVGRTMADLSRESIVWSFTTTGGGTEPPPPPGPLPSGWANRDIGGVAAAGSASHDSGVFTVRGSGADIWNTSDEFHFAYRTLTGDGSVQARVASLAGADVWTKAGVMIRESLASNSRHAAMVVSTGRGLAFQRRVSTSGISTHTSGGGGTAPRWVRLSRAGDTITAAISSDGATWTTVGSDTIPMASTVYVGLAITSHNDGALATATFDNVTFPGGTTPPPPPPPTLPEGWQSGDIGGVAAPGSASYSSGVYTVKGSGADIWGSADEFHYAYRTMDGDGSIVARVATVQFVDNWTKTGVMMRETLTAGSKHASMFVTPGGVKGLAFQRRATTGGESTHTGGGAGTAPYWVALIRSGDTFSAYVSTDGSSWTLVGTDTIPMAGTIYVGLPLTSHRDGTVATATIDNVTVVP